MELAELDHRIRQCRACEAYFASLAPQPGTNDGSLKPRPILSRPFQAPIMLIGQAPGLEEYTGGRPFSGGAGKAVRDLFGECGLSRATFDRVVYQTSAVKCFPGRSLDRGRWADIRPVKDMRNNCRTFLAEQVALVDPKLIVCMGGVAVEELDRLRDRSKRSMTKALGRAEEWDDRVVIMITHTSGANRLLNDAVNKKKQQMGLERLKAAISALRLDQTV